MIRGVPYDHQLEYIEIASTGTFRVPTGLVLPTSGVFEIRVDAYVPTEARTHNTFVSRYTSGGYGFVFSVRSGKPDLWLAGSYSLPNTVYGERHLFTLSGDGTETWTLACDGATRTINRGSNWDKGTKTISLFNPSDRFNEQAAPGDRIYSIKFIFDGEVVRDFIPVKALGVARLYDRKTGTFLVNEGTGAFVAGPVASTPLMGVHMYQAANLWKQPTVATWQSASPSTIWSPIPGVVYTSLADNGYSNSRFYDPFADGPDAILSTYSGGYCATVFLGLPPGNYVFKAETDINSNFRLLHYVPVETGWRISYGVNWGVKSAGKITYAITIPNNEMIAIYFRAQNGSTIKITNISITEATSS